MSPQKTKQSSGQNSIDSQSSHGFQSTQKKLLTKDLGWTEAEIKESHYRLKRLQEDWDAPGMEAYDNL